MIRLQNHHPIIYNAVLKQMHNFSYLKPPSRAHRILQHGHTPGARTIFGSSSAAYSSEQTQAILRLKEYLKHKNQNKNYQDSLLLRYCYLGSFKTAESVQKFKYYEQWESLPEIHKQKLKGILHSGVFYAYGRDQTYSPTIYFHPSRIDLQSFEINDYLASLRTMLQPVLDHMMIPGRIQHWNVVLDLRNFDEEKVKNNFEIIFKNLVKIMYAYPFRLKNLLIIPKDVSSLWGRKSSNQTPVFAMIKKLELDHKCVFITNLKELDKFIPNNERQCEYGGVLDDLREYWPIVSTNRLMDVNEQFINHSEDSCDYESVQNIENEEYFRDKESKPPLCDLKGNCSLF